MFRSHRLVALQEARELRRAVRVLIQDERQLVVSVHGELGAQQTVRMGLALADLVSRGPDEAHIDLADTGQVVGMGEVFVRVLTLARAHHVRVTVHRASAGQRAVLRRFGLDRLVAYSDQAP